MAAQTKQLYTYNGPACDAFGKSLGNYNLSTYAVSEKQALNNISVQIKQINHLDIKNSKIGLKSACLTVQSSTPVFTKQDLTQYCPNCGTKLTTIGECPVCDELPGATDESLTEGFIKLAPQRFISKSMLFEDTRVTLANKSRVTGLYKDASHGKNRFDRKRFSKVANSVKEYNKIDMNELFKRDQLIVGIPVLGETDNYLVQVKMEGVVAELAKSIKSNGGKLEYKNVLQSLTKIFNTKDIYIKCSCPDYKYRFAHWNIVNNVSVDDTAHDPGPGKGIANPHDDKGRGCKHVLLILANGDWIMKVASVINNYIHYASEHMQKPFLKLIFPKLYGIQPEDAENAGLVEHEEDLTSKEDLIKMINDWARERGKFKKGSNINPVQADELEAKQKAEKEKLAKEKEQQKKNNTEEPTDESEENK